MRGTVLLVDVEHTGLVDGAELRAKGLVVHEASDVPQALNRASDHDPDVVVVVLPPDDCATFAEQLRTHLDYGVSIIVVAMAESQRELAKRSGGDAFIVATADLSYEIHRALILRRSGRRLTSM